MIRLSLVFLKNNKKIILMVLSFIIVLSLIFKITLNMMFDDYIPQKFSSNLLYVEGKNLDFNELKHSQSPELSQIKYSLINYLNPYENIEKIKIDDLAFSNDASKEVEDEIIKIQLDGTNLIELPIGYNYNNDYFTNKDINVPNYTYNIQSVLVGAYPKSDEVLIGEVYANYLIKKDNLKDYSDLIGENIHVENKDCYDACINQDYKISGVYKPIHVETSEPIIIGDRNGEEYFKTNKYIVEVNNKKEKEDFIESNPEAKIYDSHDFEKINYLQIFKIVYVIIVNIIVFILLKKEIKYHAQILKVYNIGYIYKFISIGLVIVLYNLLMILVII